VAIFDVLSPAVAVGAATVPVNVGEAKFAFKASARSTYSVVAKFVELSFADCVVPLAPVTAASTAAFTNAVVATCVVFVPAVAVGAVGVPVSAGEAKGAINAFALSTYAIEALPAKPPLTKAVVARIVELSVAIAVGAAGEPVNKGDTVGALVATTLST
jgi:hypothetical protein